MKATSDTDEFKYIMVVIVLSAIDILKSGVMCMIEWISDA